MLHLAHEGLLSGQAAVPAAARRHDVEVPRDVRVPRPHGRGARHRAARPHQPGGPRARASTRSTHGSPVHTDVMKTEALKQALDAARLRRRVRRRAPRRGEVARQGARLLVPLRAAPLGPEEPAPGAVAPLQRAQASAASRSASSRSRTGPSSTSGSTSSSRRSRSCRSTSPRSGRSCERDGDADHGRRRPHAARGRRDARACARCASARSAATR